MSALPEWAADGREPDLLDALDPAPASEWCSLCCDYNDECDCDITEREPPEWAADGPKLDEVRCWVDVYDPNRDQWDACNQPTAPDSTLCEAHRAKLSEQQRVRA